MPRIQNIGLDVDGVLRDLAGKLVEVFEREYPKYKGQVLSVDEWPAWWDFQKYFPEEVNLYELSKRFQEELWVEADVYPDVSEMLNELSEERTIHIVTTQPTSKCAEYTRRWLERVGVPVRGENIYITSDKSEAPVQLLVDDMSHNLEAAESNEIIGVCRDRNWNRDWKGLRIASLRELPELIRKLERSGAAVADSRR